MKLQVLARCALLPLTCAAVLCGEEFAPRNELGFTLGAIPSLSRGTVPRNIDLGPGTALAVNYGRRILGGKKAALYGEINFLASPQRDVSSNFGSATQNFASLYLTPGIRLKFFPAGPIAPYVVAGAGYADYEQSITQLNGQPNQAPRQLGRGVFDFGAGADVRVWRWIALRAEARDFYSGSPAFNIPAIAGGQHNVAISGGFVVRWH